jgi:biopolymer transport protein ExbD
MASISSGDSNVVEINIMPMLDVFSILILFLLMSFSTDPVNHDLTKGIDLPESAITDSLDDKPFVVISKDNIYVEERALVPIQNGNIANEYLKQGAIAPLYDELSKLAKANDASSNAEIAKKGIILTLEIDRHHRFELIKKVMFTAQQAGIFRFKLMVQKEI